MLRVWSLYERVGTFEKKNVKEAITDFRKVARLPVISDERREITDTARLTLSYIFFELTGYKTALKYLREISPVFYDYPDVLLTIGWAALKLQDYQSALVALNRLVRGYPDYYNMEEAHFVIGQCFLKLGYYSFAIQEYEKIITKAPKTTDFAASIEQAKQLVAAQERRIENLRTELLVLESKLLQLLSINTGNGVPKYIIEERDRLGKRRQDLIENLMQEREDFYSVSYTVTQLRRQIEKTERQKNWRAYAEYGKARALYLKSVAEQ
ncbi:MAG: tol-pal system YbgF family protein [bacterium]